MSLSHSIVRNSSIFTFFTKAPAFFFSFNGSIDSFSFRTHRRGFHHFPSPLLHLNKNRTIPSLNKQKPAHLSTSVPLATIPTTSSTMGVVTSNKAKKRAHKESPEGLFRFNLDMCSKRGDLIEALRLYDDARIKGMQVSQHHYNVLLYICSSSTTDPDLGLTRGFEIFQQMGIDKIVPNEATFTSAARLAAKREDPGMAFELVKKMISSNIPPKLRSYGPALFGFCEKGEADKAYEVDAHMVSSDVLAEEPELAALLRLSSEVGRGEKVYEMLQRLRGSVRQVGESTAEIVEDWFKSDASIEVGRDSWNMEEIKEGILKCGGGWHGKGWLGNGKWSVVRTEVDKTGVCLNCKEKLVCIDIDPLETENFATSLSSLACQKEVKANFQKFQEWLQQNGPFDAIVDGANVGLVNDRALNFTLLNNVVNRLRQMSPSKRLPLIILHSRRVNGGPAANPNNKKLIESWRKSGALYATPTGSNDDWYWLYAAVSSKCLLVTNDEMRDHLFQLLGTSFFPRWKEKHQVRLTVSRQGLELHMPPPYSIVIQESERGSWHVPTVTGDDIEAPRQWICATRPSSLSVTPTSQTMVNLTEKTVARTPPPTSQTRVNLAEKTVARTTPTSQTRVNLSEKTVARTTPPTSQTKVNSAKKTVARTTPLTSQTRVNSAEKTVARTTPPTSQTRVNLAEKTVARTTPPTSQTRVNSTEKTVAQTTPPTSQRRVDLAEKTVAQPTPPTSQSRVKLAEKAVARLKLSDSFR